VHKVARLLHRTIRQQHHTTRAPPVTPVSSDVQTPADVYRYTGSATEITTAGTAATKRTALAARVVSSDVRTPADVFRLTGCATETTTVGTAATKQIALVARVVSSDAGTPADVFRLTGCATEITTAVTAATKRIATGRLRLDHQLEQLHAAAARPISLDAGATVSVFREAGSATVITTARTTAMRPTALGNETRL